MARASGHRSPGPFRGTRRPGGVEPTGGPPPPAGHRCQPPTYAEFEAFEARAQSYWRKTPGDWSCACCGRDERGILRIGKSGGWFGQIRVHHGPVVEEDAENLRFRSALYPRHGAVPVVEGVVTTFQCSDWGDVASELLRSRPGLSPSVLTLDDVRYCLGDVRDNRKTAVDLTKAAERWETNVRLARSMAEFNEHHDLAIGLWTAFRLLGKGRELGPLLIERARKASVDADATEGALGWLLRQGREFAGA